MSGARRYTREEDDIIINMFNKGVGLREIGKIIGRTHRAVQHRHAALVKMDGPKESKHTLCWDCRHATNPENKCPWTALDKNKEPLFKPVPGWTAEKKRFEYKNSGRWCGTYSYLVRKCPLFERGVVE